MIFQKILGQRWSGRTGRLSRLGGLALVAAVALIVIPRGTGGPLVADVQAMGGSACISAPDPRAQMLKWNTPVGFGFPTFLNPSFSTLRIEDISLTDPHNLTVHGGIVYQMERAGGRPAPLYMVAPMTAMASIANPTAWAHRQAIPGALIPPGRDTTRYQIVPEITAGSPAGGWATGEVVKYEANGRQYAADVELGVAIAKMNQADGCTVMFQAIQNAWQPPGYPPGARISSAPGPGPESAR